MKNHNGLSVALCTYNGQRYILEQLQSILNQTVLPDEIVICDDGSTDSTLDLIREISAGSPITIHVYENEQNLGSTKNFEKAIDGCKGDLIFLADQDDCWHINKVEIMLEVFTNHPNIQAVFSNGDMMDSSGNDLDYTLWSAYGVTPQKQRMINQGKAFEVLLNYNVVTGATMAFRSEYKKLLFPFPNLWVHDGWISLLLSAVGGIHCIDQPLIRYRQHDKQQIGADELNLRQELRKAKIADKGRYLHFAQQYLLALERLLSFFPADVKKAGKMSLISDKVKHSLKRGSISRDSNRLPIVAKELVSLRYFRYSNGLKSFMKDLFLY